MKNLIGQNNQTINNKVFYRNVAALVVPIALQNLINVGVSSSDVLMLLLWDEVSQASAALAGQVSFVLLLFYFGLSSGASVLTAQYWGKGDTRSIEKVIAITLRISVVVGIVFALAAWLIPDKLMLIFSEDPDVIAEGVRFLQRVAPSYIFMAFTNIYLTIMRSLERVVISTAVYFVSFLANIGFNAVLIFGLLGAPALGVEGAAIATTLARLLELIIVAIYAARNTAIRLRVKDFLGRHKVLFGDFMRYATPTVLNELFWSMAMSANVAIVGHMVTQAVSAYSVGQVMRQLATVVCFGIAAAASVMVGKAIGAGEVEKAEIYAKKLTRLSVVAGVVGGVVVFCIRPLVSHFAQLSPLADQYMNFLLIGMSVYVVAQSFNTTLIVGIFRAGGDTRFGLIVDVVSMWFGSILFGFLAAFVFKWPVEAVFLILLADELIKIPMSATRYKSKKWLRNVTR